jgi:DNA-binding transcriptional regulator YdaS (Cro superfamily)
MTKNEAVIYFGSQAALGRALGIGKASVNQWSKIPIDRQCQIEIVTGGALKADREMLSHAPAPVSTKAA